MFCSTERRFGLHGLVLMALVGSAYGEANTSLDADMGAAAAPAAPPTAPPAVAQIPPAASSAPAPAGAGGPDLANQYVLGPGDRIRVVVFGHDDLSGEFTLSANGTVALPLVGAVAGVGKTPNTLEAAIADALSPDYLRDPRVNVEVLNYRPFFIMGEVKAPGSYPYFSGITARSAIALAGGYTYRAKDKHVFISRPGEASKERRKVTPDTAVLPGDIVEVPERFF